MIRALSGVLAAVCAFAQASDYERGIALIQHGEPGAAVPFLRAASAAQPNQARVWEALGLAWAAQGMYELAEPPFGRACDLNPKLEDACYYHARALYALDRFDASLHALDHAPQDTWKVRLAIAQALEGLGRAADAEGAFHKTLTLANGSDPQPAVAFGLFLLRQGRSDEAISALERALKSFPADADAHLYLGRALVEQGKTTDALPHLEEAVKLQPASGQAHLLLAKAYVRLGRAPEAQAHFEAAANAVR